MRNSYRSSVAAAAFGALWLAAPTWAQMDHSKMGDTKMALDSTGEMTDAEVRKVDLDASRVTLKHGPIRSLDMPAMTMVFAVRDKAMLDKLKPGDKVRVKIVSEAGKFTVTELQPAK